METVIWLDSSGDRCLHTNPHRVEASSTIGNSIHSKTKAGNFKKSFSLQNLDKGLL